MGSSLDALTVCLLFVWIPMGRCDIKFFNCHMPLSSFQESQNFQKCFGILPVSRLGNLLVMSPNIEWNYDCGPIEKYMIVKVTTQSWKYTLIIGIFNHPKSIRFENCVSTNVINIWWFVRNTNAFTHKSNHAYRYYIAVQITFLLFTKWPRL